MATVAAKRRACKRACDDRVAAEGRHKHDEPMHVVRAKRRRRGADTVPEHSLADSSARVASWRTGEGECADEDGGRLGAVMKTEANALMKTEANALMKTETNALMKTDNFPQMMKAEAGRAGEGECADEDGGRLGAVMKTEANVLGAVMKTEDDWDDDPASYSGVADSGAATEPDAATLHMTIYHDLLLAKTDYDQYDEVVQGGAGTVPDPLASYSGAATVLTNDPYLLPIDDPYNEEMQFADYADFV